MGELGPELVVSNGRYFTVGNDGPEMVNLADDAIVFNHLQTERLLKNGQAPGRGRAVTNERAATSLATGNISGPAMASASAALAQLKQLRAMWESLLSASTSDLAGKGGGGGGGGGGSDGKGDTAARRAWIKEVERWYNLMQEIAKLEKEITHEETLRTKLSSDTNKNGEAYFKSQVESLRAIEQQMVAQETLNISRRDYFNQRRKQLNEDNGPFNQLYSFDEQGQLKYKSNVTINGKTWDSAFGFLSDLMTRDDAGRPKYSSEEQYNILTKAGFADYMKYDSSGKEIQLGGTDSDKGPSAEDYATFYSDSVEALFDWMDT